MENRLHDEEAANKLKKLVNDISICMFTTLDDNNKISSRPMATVHVDDDANIWFFTNEFSEKIHDVSKDNSVNLIYSKPSKNIYVNVKGTCKVIVDRKKIEKLWTPLLKAWFPQGIDDPKLCLLKVETEEAFFWSDSSSKMTVSINMLKAIVKKEKYSEGEEGKLVLNGAKK